MNIDLLLNPRTVAIVGVSPRDSSGRNIVYNLRAMRYPGSVFIVNPNYSEVAGYRCYASLSDLPIVPDVVVAAVNRERSVEIVEEAGKLGVPSAIVLATSFGESDEFGRLLQERLVNAASTHSIALLGPNCQGLINNRLNLGLFMDPVRPNAVGRIALISQSGSITTNLLNNKRGVTWSHVISTGNEIAIDCASLMHHLSNEENVDVVCLHLEAIRNPDSFREACRELLRNGKRIVALDIGKTEEAREAVRAHSGALAPEGKLVRAFLQRCGVICVDSLSELLNSCLALLTPPVRNNEALVLVASGGHGQLVLDNIGASNLILAGIAGDLRDTIDNLFPNTLSINNPLDYWGVADIETTLGSIIRAADAAGIGFIIFIGDFTEGPSGWHTRLDTSWRILRQSGVGLGARFVMIDPVSGTCSGYRAQLALGFDALALSGMRESLMALGHLSTVSSIERQIEDDDVYHEPSELMDVSVKRLTKGEAGSSIAGLEALKLIDSSGIPVVKSRKYERSLDRETFQDMRFPVVVKAGGNQILHKTERNLLVLNLMDVEAIEAAALKLRAEGCDEILVQEQVSSDSVEMILGVHRDPLLGLFIMCGMGGIWAEILEDVQIRPIGITRSDVSAMLRNLKGWKLLTGARGRKEANVDAIIEAMLALDHFAQANSDLIQNIDINPLMIAGEEIFAVDAIITF